MFSDRESQCESGMVLMQSQRLGAYANLGYTVDFRPAQATVTLTQSKQNPTFYGSRTIYAHINTEECFLKECALQGKARPQLWGSISKFIGRPSMRGVRMGSKQGHVDSTRRGNKHAAGIAEEETA